MKTTQQIVAEASREMNLRVEQQMGLWLQPRPWWLPAFAWRFLIRHLVVRVHGPPKMMVEFGPDRIWGDTPHTDVNYPWGRL